MIGWILARLTEHPGTSFSERELLANDETSFRVLRELRILHRLPMLGHGDSLVRDGRILTILETPGGGLEAVCEDEPSLPAVELEEPDLVEWAVNLDRFGLEVQRRNNLQGPVEMLDDRLLLCGGNQHGRLRLALVVGFFPETQRMLSRLQTLAITLGKRFDRIVVASAASPPPADGSRDLAAQSVLLTGLDGSLVVDLDSVLRERARSAPVVELSAGEEEEFRRARFLSREAIFISGVTEARSQNVVEVNGVAARLGDASLRPLMRLLVGLFETDDGWVLENELLGLDGTMAADIDNLLLRIRAPFRSASIECKPTELIQKVSSRIRLSTHRRFVSYDRERLAKHNDLTVRRLAEQLPPAQ